MYHGAFWSATVHDGNNKIMIISLFVTVLGADHPLASCRYLDSNQNNSIDVGIYVVGSLVGITVVSVSFLYLPYLFMFLFCLCRKPAEEVLFVLSFHFSHYSCFASSSSLLLAHI